MNDILIGLLILAATSLLPITAYRSNLRSDASWERMRRELTPTLQYDPSTPKAFYSKKFPALNHASAHDNGYYHTLMHPFDLTPGSVNYVE
jgi:hypothetical protein